jgi:hypothetical protein
MRLLLLLATSVLAVSASVVGRDNLSEKRIYHFNVPIILNTDLSQARSVPKFALPPNRTADRVWLLSK